MDAQAMEAFESLLIVSLTLPQGPKWREFAAEVQKRSKENFDFEFDEEVRIPSTTCMTPANETQIMEFCVTGKLVRGRLLRQRHLPCNGVQQNSRRRTRS